jgi:hypothetical protein
LIKRSDKCVSIIISDNTQDVKLRNTIEIQIILRIYNSINEVLLGFDIDSSSFAFDGNDILSTKRGIYSLSNMINTVDLSRHSRTYVRRLYKYAMRGFRVYIPFFKRKYATYKGNYNTSGIIISYTKSNSLGYLLSLENTSIRRIIHNNVNDYCISYNMSDLETKRIFGKGKVEYHIIDKDDKMPFISEMNRIIDLVTRENRFENIMSIINAYEKNREEFKLYEIIMSFTGPINYIEDIYIDETFKIPYMFNSKVKYLTKNPGTQFTSSFNPLDINIVEWYKDIDLPHFYLDKLKLFQ